MKKITTIIACILFSSSFAWSQCDPALTGSDAATFCTGDSYVFGTQTLAIGGIYSEVFTSVVTGCDSTVTLTLTENLTGTDAASICTGDSYVFGTQILAMGGTYSEVFTSVVSGCDSTVTLTLTENPVLTGTDAASICIGGSYVFGSQTLAIGGIYSEVFASSVTGCDSIVTLTLTENPVLTGSDDATICSGDSYDFGTQILTIGGIYSEVFTSVVTGCDSTVTLTLTEIALPAITVVSTTDEMFGNDGAIDINVTGGFLYLYVWDNGGLTEDITGLAGGVYTVVVLDLLTFCFAIQMVMVNSQLGIVELSEGLFEVFPNPSNGVFNVKIKELNEDMEIVIINSFGQQVLKTQITESTTKVDISGVSAGTYFVRVTSNKGNSVKPIVIK